MATNLSKDTPTITLHLNGEVPVIRIDNHFYNNVVPNDYFTILPNDTPRKVDQEKPIQPYNDTNQNN
jgi:hypothetical protein